MDIGSPHFKSFNKIIRDYFSYIASLDYDLETASDNGVIYLDLYHSNIIYTLRILLTGKYLQLITRRKLIGLTGLPGVVKTTCGCYDNAAHIALAKSFGIVDFLDYSSELRDGFAADAGRLIEDLSIKSSDIADFRTRLQAYQDANGFHIGRFIYDTIIRSQLCATISENQENLIHWSADTLSYASWADNHINFENKPFFVTGHVDYNPWGLLAEKIIHAGGEAFWVTNNDRFNVFRLNSPDQMLSGQVADTEAKVFKELMAKNGDKIVENANIYLGYKDAMPFHGNWTQKNGYFCDIELAGILKRQVVNYFDWDADKKIISIFTHAYADQPVSCEQIFDDRYQWLEKTLEFAASHDEFNWLVKIHPSDLAYDIVFTTNRLMERFQHHKHIKFINNQIPINLMNELTDVAVTLIGYPGLQLASLGKPVICAAKGNYTESGFVTRCKSQKQYFEALSIINEGYDADIAKNAKAYMYLNNIGANISCALLPDKINAIPDDLLWQIIGDKFLTYNFYEDMLFKELFALMGNVSGRTVNGDLLKYLDDFSKFKTPDRINGNRVIAKINEAVNFSHGSYGANSLYFGFHNPEFWGCWTNGELGIIAIQPDDAIDLKQNLQMDFEFSIGRTVLPPFKIKINNEIVYDGLLPHIASVDLPKLEGEYLAQNIFIVEFICTKPFMPAKITDSTDKRIFGIGLISAKITQKD